MKICINGIMQEVQDRMFVIELLSLLDLAGRRIVVELNQELDLAVVLIANV